MLSSTVPSLRKWAQSLYSYRSIVCLQLYIVFFGHSLPTKTTSSTLSLGMIFGRKGYQPLFTQAEENDHASKLNTHITSSNTLAFRILALVAVIASLGNALFAVYTFRSMSTETSNKDRSLYAGLEREIPVPYRDRTMFNNPNRSISDAAWDDWIVDPGIVALPNNWVKGKMLPQAQHWPWDEDKGLYLLQGFHNIHCLVRIRRFNPDLLN